MSPAERYPALMAYIATRSAVRPWHDQLGEDKRAALRGELADVAADLRRAQADYGKYPYNSAMGEFLGLGLRENHEPPHGYYMASQVMSYFALGEAEREARALVEQGKTLKLVAARAKATRKPVRFHAFTGPAQIQIGEGCVTLANGKVRATLSGGYSVESVMQNLAAALRTGAAYGEAGA